MATNAGRSGRRYVNSRGQCERAGGKRIQLTSVRLKNVLTFEDARVEINPEGVSVLVGPNGAGPTNVFRAVGLTPTDLSRNLRVKLWLSGRTIAGASFWYAVQDSPSTLQSRGGLQGPFGAAWRNRMTRADVRQEEHQRRTGHKAGLEQVGRGSLRRDGPQAVAEGFGCVGRPTAPSKYRHAVLPEAARRWQPGTVGGRNSPGGR